MAVETDTERATMLADFGELVTFSPGDVWPNRSDTTASIRVIFDAEYIELPGDRIGINSNALIAQARTSDISGAVRNSVLERSDGKLYKVTAVQDDGTGMTVLELEGPR